LTHRISTSWPACHPPIASTGRSSLADEDALSEKDVGAIAAGLLNAQQQRKFDEEWELCISLLQPRRRACPGDILPAQRASGNELPLLRRAHRDAESWGCRRRLMTWRANQTAGPDHRTTGAGKTTTLNYLVDLINGERRCKIVTIEDPIEFRAREQRAIVVQQEVLTDVRSFNRR